jgi:hypothetical protein
MVLAAAWGGVWAISSYFVSRSHAANLLSIATFLVFAIAISLRVIADQPAEVWHGLVRVAVVPLFAGPIALTFAHPLFARHIATPQLTYGAFTEQIPLMEPSLNALLLEAGAKPTDPVVRIGDARLDASGVAGPELLAGQKSSAPTHGCPNSMKLSRPCRRTGGRNTSTG